MIDEDVKGYKRLLLNGEFTKFFGAKTISVVGDSLYVVASMWLVYELTDSTFFTGLSAVLARLPGTFNFLVGPIADRYNPSFVLSVTEVVQMLVVLLVPLYAAFWKLNIFVVLAIIPLLSITNQFAKPAQSVALPRLVGDDLLVKANAVFAFTHRGTQAASKTASGFLIASIGAVHVYTLNAVTFLLGAVMYSLVVVPDVAEGNAKDGSNEDADTRNPLQSYYQDLVGGLDTVYGSVIQYVLLLVALGNFLIGISTAILPAFASTISGPSAYGILYAGTGLGLFVGAAVSSYFEELPFGLLPVALFGFSGVFWVMAINVSTFSLTVVLYTIAWIPLGVHNVLSSSLLQSGVHDGSLGRVMSIGDSMGDLLTALGLLVGGIAGDIWASTHVMSVTGGGLLVLGLCWIAIPEARALSSVTDTDELSD